MDGKHVVLQAPFNSGSEFFNYKKSFSIVLLVLADCDYNILYADIGSHGRMSDGGVFNCSLLHEKIYKNNNMFPPSAALPNQNTPVPYVIVGDSAFALSPRLMKPYPGTPPIGSKQRIFNQQLSRARVVIENTFGIISAIFRVLRKPMLLQPQGATRVVHTCVYLHNFLKQSTTSRNLYVHA